MLSMMSMSDEMQPVRMIRGCFTQSIEILFLDVELNEEMLVTQVGRERVSCQKWRKRKRKWTSYQEEDQSDFRFYSLLSGSACKLLTPSGTGLLHPYTGIILP